MAFDCILVDRETEVDREEGLFDMLVLAAVQLARKTGEDVVLASRSRERRVEPNQALKLKPVKQPSEDEMTDIIPQSA